MMTIAGRRAVLVMAALALGACGDGEATVSGTSSTAPAASSTPILEIDPPTALASATRVRLSVSGAPAAVSWDLGDGAHTTGTPVEHVYTGGGVYTVTASVTRDGDTFTLPAAIDVKALNGTWTDPLAALIVNLTQSGAALDGSFQYGRFEPDTLSGGVSHPKVVRLSMPRGNSALLRFTGEMNQACDTIVGTLELCRVDETSCNREVAVLRHG